MIISRGWLSGCRPGLQAASELLLPGCPPLWDLRRRGLQRLEYLTLLRRRLPRALALFGALRAPAVLVTVGAARRSDLSLLP